MDRPSASPLQLFLSAHGLVHLLPLLESAGVDLDVLGDLTELDLERSGLNLGDRKRLLKAASALGQPGSDSAPIATPQQDAVLSNEV
jgi:hypothetical protein